jgi:nucleoside phosphorylase
MPRATFSDLRSALPKLHRTDRMHVLAALYSLDGDEVPQTAAEVRRLLKLHLGARTPANISACLRRYSSEVEVHAGSPLRWTLTRLGVASIRSCTGLELRGKATRTDYGVDIGVVCALEHPEFAAVVAATGGSAAWKETVDPDTPHRYRSATITTHQGKPLHVVGTTAMSMGLTSAAIVTTQLVLKYRPRIVIMCGIAAGTRQGNKQFGDVLVADPSVDYNSGKVVEAGGIREFLPDPYPIGIHPRVRSLLFKYLDAPEVFRQLRSRWAGQVPSNANRVHLGPLGAADQVIDDASRVLEIQKNWRKLIGVEMETYGVYRACHDAPEPKPRFISFKSVCDFADNKSDAWQRFAAFMAAEFAFEFMRAEWSAMWPVVPAE